MLAPLRVAKCRDHEPTVDLPAGAGCICGDVLSTHCRKYDVEGEALKLFGEELPAVIARFRKSPEYEAILQGKVKEIVGTVDDMSIQIIEQFSNKLEEKITIDVTEGHHSGYEGRRPLSEASEGEAPGRPVGAPLERFVLQRSVLPAARKNRYKDFAFEYAGRAIHELIKHLGPEEAPPQSTVMAGGARRPRLTPHAALHQVTRESNRLTAAEDSSGVYRAESRGAPPAPAARSRIAPKRNSTSLSRDYKISQHPK